LDKCRNQNSWEDIVLAGLAQTNRCEKGLERNLVWWWVNASLFERSSYSVCRSNLFDNNKPTRIDGTGQRGQKGKAAVHRHTHTPLFSSTLPTPLAHTLGTSYIRDVSPYVSSGIRSRKENMYKLNQGKISFTLSALHKLA
jgi:hypothetical protein